MNKEAQVPSWHKDAKWIFGLFLAMSLSFTFLFYNLSKITEEESAVDALTLGIALSFSRNGLDDKTEITILRRMVAGNPEKTIQPIPGLKLYIKGGDILNLSPREVRLKLFRQLALPIYKGGTDGLASLAESKEMKKSVEGGVGFLSIVSENSHNFLRKIFFILTVISFFLFVPFIFFSRRFGRIINAGLIILIAAFPLGIIFNFLNLVLQGQTPPVTPPSGDAGLAGMAGYLAGNVLPPVIKIVAQNYLFIMFSGLAIVTVGVLAALFLKIFKKNNNI